jgi:hypothetical protein
VMPRVGWDQRTDTARRPPMTHLTAHRNGVLFLLAVVAIAGCASRLDTGNGTAGSAAPVSATAAAAASAAPSLDSGALAQQLTSIDQQLGAIDGQLSAANAGLSTSEGDPAQ